MPVAEPVPFANIRRFDVFAEWNRLLGLERHHLSADEARAFGIAVAKIVAARKFSGYHPDQIRDVKRQAKQREKQAGDWWRHFGSDYEFDRKIVRRMGGDFYTEIFQPAIRSAWDGGKKYETIRDLIRAEWNAELDRMSRTGGR